MRDKFVLQKALENGEVLTFDDVRLQPGYSEVLPGDINLESKFSKNVTLKIPIVSAAMDTVTEYKMAIELAKLGGIGIIHRGLSIKDQAKQVLSVKRYLNGLIERPKHVLEEDSVESVLKKRQEKGWDFYSFLVLNTDGKLVGLISGNDFEFCGDNSKLIRDIMTADPLTAQIGTTIDQAYEIMIREKKKMLPLVGKNGELGGLYVFSDVKRIKTGSAASYNVDAKQRLRVGGAIGAGEKALERADALVGKDVDVLVIDTAHADTKSVHETLQELKKNYSVDVVVGNVSIGEAAKRLVDKGADGVKIGQGPGSICTTRIVAGYGRPQVSAVYDCARAIDGSEVPICADGGIKYSGDIPIILAAGAHSIMMGGLLAGTYESPGETIFYEGKTWKTYRGMGSLEAMRESLGAMERYLQTDPTKLVPQGIEGLVPYQGRLEDVIFQHVGGLRGGMGAVGARNIEELRDKGDVDRLTSAGFQESHPHNIRITKDAPNYPGR